MGCITQAGVEVHEVLIIMPPRGELLVLMPLRIDERALADLVGGGVRIVGWEELDRVQRGAVAMQAVLREAGEVERRAAGLATQARALRWFAVGVLLFAVARLLL